MNEKKRVYLFNHWWNRNNYGAILTAYALQRIIDDYGYETYLINDVGQKVFDIIDRKYTSTLHFKEKYMKSLVGFKNHTDFIKLNDTADTFIVGSDQVFRGIFLNQPRIDEYMLNFASVKSKKIAFSASYALDKQDYLKEITPDFLEKFKTYIKSFDFISVREASGIEICRDLFGVDAELIIDPVFILDKSNYDKLIEDSTINYKDKIVSYVLDTSDDYEKAYDFLSQKYNKKVVETANSNISIENWLASVRDCDLFITDSFHGMCFALIFNKPFICLANRSRGGSRFESICEMLGVANQCIESINDVIHKDVVFKVDYDNVNQRIKCERKKGLKFLKKAFDAPIKISQEKIDAKMAYLENQILELDKRDNLRYQLKKYFWGNWLIIYNYYLPKPIKFIIGFFWHIIKKKEK